MLHILSRSRSLRGGHHHKDHQKDHQNDKKDHHHGHNNTAASDDASATTNHAAGQGKTHGPNAPLSLLSTMVVPSNTPAFVIPTVATAGGQGGPAEATTSTTVSTTSFSSSSASSFSSSSFSSSNTAASSISNVSSIEPGFVSKPTLQTSTVLGLLLSKPISRPPSPGIDGKRECPYVNRPLPPPPPPKTPSTNPYNAANMPSRPNTSGGGAPSRPAAPSAFSSSLAPPSNPNFNRRISRDDMFLGSQTKKSSAAFDKRISRDDLYLGTRPPAARSSAFHVPNRTQPATVEEGSFDLGLPPAPSAWPTRRDTPESIMSGEIQIGMALGSPVRTSPPEPMTFRQPQRAQTDRMQRAEPATYASWQPQESAQTHDSLAASSDKLSEPQTEQPSVTTTNDVPVQRSKTTRRKLFGLFGSKRHHDPVKSTLTSTSSNYSLEASDSSSVVMTAAIPTASSSSAERPVTRSGNRKHQPIIVQIVPEPATTTNIKASNNSPALSSTGAGMNTAQNVKEGGRSMRPFLRSKASEPAIRKKGDISAPMSLGLGNNTMTNLNSVYSNNGNGLGVPAMPGSNASSHLMPPPMLGASPYLDVEIPEARMERYSVMFGSLLGSGQSWQPASSLLARRQATLDKLKTINDRIHQEDLERNYVAAAAADAMATINGLPSPGLQRRATSPHVTRSPGFSLFPGRSPSTGHAHAPLPSPRMRSNTSPAATRSPMRSEFDFLQPPGMAITTQQQPSPQRYISNPLRTNPPSVVNRQGPPMKSKTMPVTTMSSSPSGQPSKSVIRFDPSQSSLILDSPTEMDYPVEQLQQPFKPVIQEPQWQMISPPSSTGSSSSGSSNSRSKASGSPASTASLEFDVEEPDKELKSAVEISIARQISISRQQRQLLRPLKTNNLAPPPLAAIPSGNTPISSTSSPARSATLKLGRNERLQETKTSTPTLVEPPSLLSDNDNGRGQAMDQQSQSQQQQRMRYLSPRSNANANSNLQAYQMAHNRKSERVILEAV
ncbi:hypothetical protein SBRCBS47491_009440 [Sporothrix bragantina]|uniref:Proteophosphoglycan ppg4 n=1 Tax=Sporothrix bragantina TaxID=671064 RepID=A0ABP0CUR0_9PEZI